MTAPRPCDVCPDIPCATGEKCHGVAYWTGKPGTAKGLGKVEDCKWRKECRNWYLKRGKNGRESQ